MRFKIMLWAAVIGMTLVSFVQAQTVVPQIVSIGAEEALPGGFAGRLTAIAVDSKNQPHIAADGGAFVCLYDKINGTWTDLLVDVGALCGSQQYYNPHIEIDQTLDILWMSGILYGGRMGIGVISRTGISTAPSAINFTIKWVVPASTWPCGLLSTDPGRPGEMVVSASGGYWERCVYDPSQGGARTTETGRMYAGQGGEKNAFNISKAGNVLHPDGTTHGIWHGAIGGWEGWSSSYINSYLQAQGVAPITWASFRPYGAQNDDGTYVTVCADAKSPHTAYIASSFVSAHYGREGVAMNIWDGTNMVRNPSSIIPIDPDGSSGLRRFAPQMAAAKNGGVFISWTRDGFVYIRYVDSRGEMGAENRICDGTLSSLATDRQGNLHLAYNSNGYIRYRKLSVSGAGVVKGDFDGDGKTDPAVFKTETGTWQFLASGLNHQLQVTTFGAGETATTGDFDGDGKADLTVYDEPTGILAIGLSSVSGQVILRQLGGPGCVSVAGDYDAEGGKTDPAVYNETTGLWSIELSNTGWLRQDFTFGGPGWLAAPGDYDADFKTDPAIYNPTTGQWILTLSSIGHYPLAVNTPFIGETLVPVAGDFDADGYTDFGVYSENTGWAIVLTSTIFNPSPTVITVPEFCHSGCVPVTGDFDGDSKADPALYSQSLAAWAVAFSSINYFVVPFSLPVGDTGYDLIYKSY